MTAPVSSKPKAPIQPQVEIARENWQRTRS